MKIISNERFLPLYILKISDIIMSYKGGFFKIIKNEINNNKP